MFNVLIIGGGNIGFRHFEGLLLTGLPLAVYVIDPDSEALNRIKKRYESSVLKNILCHTAVSLINIPEKIDLCIIATNSKVRLEMAEKVLKSASVSYLILEKVLFQKKNDYDEMSNLLKEHQVNGCWVNCPLRTLSIYREIKQKIKTNVTLCVEYKHFGIGCNSIHQLDLFSYLTDSTNINVDTTQLERVIESKRKGYLEIIGTLKAYTNNGDALTIVSNEQASDEYFITFRFEHEIWTIYPLLEKCKIKSVHHGNLSERVIHYPKQSYLTSLLANEILISGSCTLPDYETSKQLHLSLIDPFNQFFSKALGYEVKECPIT